MFPLVLLAILPMMNSYHYAVSARDNVYIAPGDGGRTVCGLVAYTLPPTDVGANCKVYLKDGDWHANAYAVTCEVSCYTLPDDRNSTFETTDYEVSGWCDDGMLTVYPGLQRSWDANLYLTAADGYAHHVYYGGDPVQINATCSGREYLSLAYARTVVRGDRRVQVVHYARDTTARASFCFLASCGGAIDQASCGVRQQPNATFYAAGGGMTCYTLYGAPPACGGVISIPDGSAGFCDTYNSGFGRAGDPQPACSCDAECEGGVKCVAVDQLPPVCESVCNECCGDDDGEPQSHSSSCDSQNTLNVVLIVAFSLLALLNAVQCMRTCRPAKAADSTYAAMMT